MRVLLQADWNKYNTYEKSGAAASLYGPLSAAGSPCSSLKKDAAC